MLYGVSWRNSQETVIRFALRKINVDKSECTTAADWQCELITAWYKPADSE